MSYVAVVIPSLDRIGGAEQQAALLARGLRRRGWRVSVVALSGSGGTAARELRRAGVEFLTLEMRKGLADPRGWIRFQRWLWRERPDVVHAHLPHAAWLARWSRLTAPVPLVIDTLHSSHTGTLGRRLGYACSRWLVDHVTAVSHATSASHLSAGMVSKNNLSVLGNGIDLAAWRPDARARSAKRRELGLADEFLWLAVGRLNPVKDYSTLLDAFARAPETARLLVAGAGPLHGELVRQAKRLGLQQCVRFLGYQPKVEPWIQAADGFVLSSRYEGLPMVLLEAGACGLPVAATDVPGTREVVANGETGWLARAGDAGDLAKAMARVMQMPPEERRAMGERGRQHVVEEFGMEAVLDRWEQLYAELLDRKRVRRRNCPNAREDLRRQSAASA